jgi:hypothetical protein
MGLTKYAVEVRSGDLNIYCVSQRLGKGGIQKLLDRGIHRVTDSMEIT